MTLGISFGFFRRHRQRHLRFLKAAAGVIALAGLLGGGAGPAAAGFEWTPPDKQSKPMAVPAVEAEELEAGDAPQQAPDEAPRPDQSSPKPAAQELLQAVPTKTLSGPASPAKEKKDEPADMQEPVLKVKEISKPEAPAVSRPPEDMKMPADPGGLKAKARQPRPAPQKPATVSVPPDAASAAVEKEEEEKEEKKRSLLINPYPLDQKPAAAGKAADRQFEKAVGFGSDMALALALRQVVPPQYSFSFAKGVNPGYRVSWSGGAPWNEVVQNMIAPLDLTSEIRGKTLIIKPAGGNGPAAGMQQPEPAEEAAYAPMAPAQKEPEKMASMPSGGADLPPAQPRRRKPARPGENDIETAAGPADAETDRQAERQLLRQGKAGTVKLSSGGPAADRDQSINQPRIWEAKEGDSLKDILDQWSAQANVDLVWNAAQDYRLDSGVLINGTFGSAVTVLFMHGLEPGSAPGHRLSEEGGKSSLIIEDKAS